MSCLGLNDDLHSMMISYSYASAFISKHGQFMFIGSLVVWRIEASLSSSMSFRTVSTIDTGLVGVSVRQCHLHPVSACAGAVVACFQPV